MTTDATGTTGEMAGALDVLACEYEKRPKGAPSFFDLQSAIRGVRREDGALVVDFDRAAAAAVEQLVAAERLCCPEIDWDLTPEPAPRLTIRATPGQLEVIEQFLSA